MTRQRSKTQIEQQIADDERYREDIEYIKATLAAGNVFIGQLTSEQTGNTEASFCVTVGMYLHDLPELVFSGVPVPVVKGIVSDLCEGNDFDREFLAGGRTMSIMDIDVMAVPVSSPENHDVFSVCYDFYTLIDRSSFQAVQIVFANEGGAFPWGVGYAEHEKQFQPVLGLSGIAN
jgi:hypothetical protein